MLYEFRRYYYFRLVGCHLGFTHGVELAMIAGHLHVSYIYNNKLYNNKPLYCFWNDTRIYKTSKVISTSGHLAGILDF